MTILPQVNVRLYEPLARRFAESYVRNPPGLEPHEIVVISNGGPIQERQKRLFGPLPCRWMEHNNMGRDLGGFQLAAEKIPADLMIFFGSHVHFCRAGWLDRMVEVFLQNGPGLYGAWGFEQPARHIRTTAWWLPPELLRAYPTWVGDRQRYAFEHGPQSITSFVHNLGFPVIQVGWTKALDYGHWEHFDQNESIFRDQHTATLGWNAR